MKFDILDQYFQYRHFLSDSLSNGIWPLWLPWQYYGFPYFADPQGAAWYSPSWIIAAFRPYDLYSLYFEWLAHVFWGGLGFFFLLRKLGISILAALTMAILFECNGIFLGNAQHFTYVISMAWLPWVFLSFYQIIFRPQLKWSIAGGVILHFFLTGGYPAFFFIIIYALAALVTLQVIRHIRKGHKEKLKRLGIHLFFAGSIFLLLSVGYLYSIFEAQGLMLRSSAIAMEDILFGPYPPKALISSILPMTVTGHQAFWGADISMIQGFIGLLPFFFLPLAFMDARYRRVKIGIALAGGLSLLAAFGDATFVREGLSHLPLLDRFRFPSIFRAFWMLSVLILGAWGFDALSTLRKTIRWRGIGLSLLGLAIILMIFGRWLPESSSEAGDFPWQGLLFQSELLRPFIESGSPFEKFFPGLILLLSFLFLYLTALFTKPSLRPYALLTIAAIEGFCAVQLTHTMTITHPRPATAYQAALKEMPEGYPIPDETPVHDNRPADPRFLPSWYNNNIFTKTVSPNGLNPFKLRAMSDMEKQDCYQRALPSPVVFFTDSSAQGSHYHFQEWQPGHFTLDVKISRPDTLVVQQSYYPGWFATRNDSPANITPWCGHLLSLPVPSGESQITFTFQRADIKVLWIWQGFLTLFCSLFFIFPFFRELNK